MTFLHLLLVVFYLYFTVTEAAEGTCKAVSYRGRFSAREYVQDYGTNKHVFKTITASSVQQCFSGCTSECRCIAYQLKDSLCELLDKDRQTAPSHFKAKPGYKYFELKQQFVPRENAVACGCRNGCCRSSPCINEGTCVELCDDVKHKFKCVCPNGVKGKLCHQVDSCPTILKYNKMAASGLYKIRNSTGGQMKIYCDFTSEPAMVWTLVETFSLANNNLFKSSPLSSNNPQNEKSFNWNLFRLSLQTMNYIKGHSTHWRATCNFNTDGLKYRDYVRAKLTSADITTWTQDDYTCIMYERVSVRGQGCQLCTGYFKQTSSQHGFVDSYWSSRPGNPCQFDALNGATAGSCYRGCMGEDNFGKYDVQNTAHACSASASSTTQWWMGVQVNN